MLPDTLEIFKPELWPDRLAPDDTYAEVDKLLRDYQHLFLDDDPVQPVHEVSYITGREGVD